MRPKIEPETEITALLRQATEAHGVGDLAHHEGLLRALLTRDPGHAEALSQLGGLMLKSGRRQRARRMPPRHRSPP